MKEELCVSSVTALIQTAARGTYALISIRSSLLSNRRRLRPRRTVRFNRSSGVIDLPMVAILACIWPTLDRNLLIWSKDETGCDHRFGHGLPSIGFTSVI